MIRLLRIIFLFAVAVLGGAFASLNGQIVELDYYFGLTELPLSIIILIALGIGAIFGMIAGLLLFVKAKRENLSLKKKAQLVNEEVKNLRTFPLKDR